MELLKKATELLKGCTELGLALLAFGVVAQVLFGAAVPFVQVDVVGAVVEVTNKLGSEGLVGLVAVFLLVSLFNRQQST